MKKRSFKTIVGLAFLAFITGSVQASDWATGEGSCFFKEQQGSQRGIEHVRFWFLCRV